MSDLIFCHTRCGPVYNSPRAVVERGEWVGRWLGGWVGMVMCVGGGCVFLYWGGLGWVECPDK